MLGDARLRTAYLLSVADVFFGALGVLVVLIVLSANRDEARILEPIDMRAACTGSSAADLVLIPEGGEALPMREVLERLPEDRFLVRYAIRPEGEDLACYLLARAAAQAHNRALEARGTVQAVLAVEYWSGAAGP